MFFILVVFVVTICRTEFPLPSRTSRSRTSGAVTPSRRTTRRLCGGTRKTKRDSRRSARRGQSFFLRKVFRITGRRCRRRARGAGEVGRSWAGDRGGVAWCAGAVRRAEAAGWRVGVHRYSGWGCIDSGWGVCLVGGTSRCHRRAESSCSRRTSSSRVVL